MSPYPLVAGGVFGAATVAEVVTTSPNSGLLAPLIGGVASVLVAGIAAYAVIRQRRQNAPDELNALAVAKTAEANVATMREEVQRVIDRLDRIEEHVRPWPKAQP